MIKDACQKTLVIPIRQRYGMVFLLKIALISAFSVIAMAQSGAADNNVVRYPIPNSNFPISRATEVSTGVSIVYLSGALAGISDESKDGNSQAAYGDTKTQTVSALKSIEETLHAMKLEMSDIVKMQVFLVGVPDNGGKMDFGGFMEGYKQFFGTPAQPNLPSRSVVQVAGLAGPQYLVEIEVTAARH